MARKIGRAKELRALHTPQERKSGSRRDFQNQRLQRAIWQIRKALLVALLNRRNAPVLLIAPLESQFPS
jgi:hypothetical protein